MRRKLDFLIKFCYKNVEWKNFETIAKAINLFLYNDIWAHFLTENFIKQYRSLNIIKLRLSLNK
jgi:hypothetical protein